LTRHICILEPSKRLLCLRLKHEMTVKWTDGKDEDVIYRELCEFWRHCLSQRTTCFYYFIFIVVTCFGILYHLLAQLSKDPSAAEYTGGIISFLFKPPGEDVRKIYSFSLGFLSVVGWTFSYVLRRYVQMVDVIQKNLRAGSLEKPQLRNKITSTRAMYLVTMLFSDLFAGLAVAICFAGCFQQMCFLTLICSCIIFAVHACLFFRLFPRLHIGEPPEDFFMPPSHRKSKISEGTSKIS